MDAIVNFIKSIPDVVWAAISASALTIVGVLLSNSSSTKRLKLQLWHDAQEKDKDRKNDLRKNVYLKTAEEITYAIQYIVTLFEHDMSKENIGIGLKGLSAAIYQANLIASPETVNSLNEFITSYAESFLKLIQTLIPLQKIRTDINILNQTYENHSANVKKLLQEIEESNKRGQVDQLAWINKMFEFNQSECEKISKEINMKQVQFYNLQKKFIRDAITEIKPIYSLTISALVNIRKELGLKTDETKYKIQLEKHFEKMTLSLDSLLEKVEKEFL